MRWWKSGSYACTDCKKKFDFESIRYGSDGKTIRCVSCHEQVLREEQKKREAEAKPKAAPVMSDVLKLICVECRYKFSYRKGSRIQPVCPYCGKSRLMIDDTTADRLVEEVGRIRDWEKARRSGAAS